MCLSRVRYIYGKFARVEHHRNAIHRKASPLTGVTLVPGTSNRHSSEGLVQGFRSDPVPASGDQYETI